MPLGSTKEKQVDVRVVAATNAALPGEIEAGRFRGRTCSSRLSPVYGVEVPLLRQRREDIPLLAGHFMTLFAPGNGPPHGPSNRTRGAGPARPL